MSSIARGAFEVNMQPQPQEGGAISRMLLAKTYDGDLKATGQGQMLAAMTDVKGSAGYVAIERVSGTLQGRAGSFALQHSGIMNRGAPELTITVVPDSGTGDLAGLSGRLSITIEGGAHSYVLEYTIDDRP